MIRLEADDPQVRARTRLAFLDSHRQGADAPLTMRCRGRCGAVLAYAGNTEHGILFMSGWEIPDQYRGIVNDVVLTGKRAREAERQGWILMRSMFGATDPPKVSGPPIDEPERHGVIALLDLPVGVTADYPDLLVRCTKHGDALLDRETVIGWVNDDARTKPIEVALPHLEYRPPARDAYVDLGPRITSTEGWA